MRLVTRASDEWPLQIDHLGRAAPAALYVRGERSVAELAASPSVAIVGARRCSRAALAFTRTLAGELAARGVSVISGLALGVDAAAHEGALACEGRTIAVLGCGIDRLYPRTNDDLAHKVIGQGAVISEWGPGVEPAPWRFPVRNRLVAALADVTVVIEASRRSGALITADHALALGRDVFAVPGSPWSELGQGTLKLLRAGAIPVGSAADVLDELGLQITVQLTVEAPVGDPGIVWAALRERPRSRQAIAVLPGISAARAAAAVTELELADLIVVERDGTLVALEPTVSSVGYTRRDQGV